MARRIVVEDACPECGRHHVMPLLKPGGHPESSIAYCAEGTVRRVLDPGSFVDLVAAALHDHGAVKAASGNWVDTPTAEGCPRAEAHFGAAQRIWDALAGGEQP